MYIPRLKEKYLKEIVPNMQKQEGYSSPMQVPRLEKICINQGLGGGTSNKKVIEIGIQELTSIAGQCAVATKAKGSISNFKLREGVSIGVKVTLRGMRMYEFLDRLITVALPRVRDFRGVTSKLDSQANYTIGLKEQVIFPEISMDRVNKISGMNITFVIQGKDRTANTKLLKAFGMPFVNSYR